MSGPKQQPEGFLKEAVAPPVPCPLAASFRGFSGRFSSVQGTSGLEEGLGRGERLASARQAPILVPFKPQTLRMHSWPG